MTRRFFAAAIAVAGFLACQSANENVGGSSAALEAGATPLKVGAIYYDGWASSTYRDGFLEPTASLLESASWQSRMPALGSGWDDGDPVALERASAIARAEHLSFWVFDWFNYAIDHPFQHAVETFRKLRNRHGMQYALLVILDGTNASGNPDVSQWSAFIDYWLSLFQDPSYLKVNGVPIIFWYSYPTFDKAFGGQAGIGKAITDLQQRARATFPAPGAFVYVTASPGPPPNGAQVYCPFDDLPTIDGAKFTGITHYGYNAGCTSLEKDGPSHDQAAENPFSSISDRATLYWNNVIAARQSGTTLQYIPTAAVGFNAGPWEFEQWAHAYYDRTPADVGALTQTVAERLLATPSVWAGPNDALMLIGQWNELGEGGYVVPTIGDGTQYLDAIRKAIEQVGGAQ